MDLSLMLIRSDVKINSMRTIKLMTDYGCFPLWGVGEIGNINPEHLPLTLDLKRALGVWASAYDKTLNQEYPPDSGFASPAEEEVFEVEGRRLWRTLQEQLGPAFKVVYFSNRNNKLCE